ncbi:MAG: phosphatidylglycerophosphatase A family protein [Planctomycetota bacterium]|jgi:phosphatidylglycerophosphatase A
MNRIKKAILSGLGTGYLPIAPGTWGSAAVAVIFLAVAWGSGGRWYCVSGTMLVMAVLASVACVKLGRFCEEAYGKKDASQCTIDEWAGQGVSYFLLPLGSGNIDYLLAAAVGFFVFRIFDIIKPPPGRRFEKLPFGWGVLLDDIVAGIYANIASQLILRLWLLEVF